MMARKNNVKGQAAMEYLMMYGWAIFLIGVVVAVLVGVLAIMNSQERCLFVQKEFSCSSDVNPAAYLDGNGNVMVAMRVVNNAGKSIVLKEATCVRGDAQVGSIPDGAWVPVSSTGRDVQLNPGSSLDVSDIPCYEPGSNSKVAMSAGQNFAGNVIFKYNYVNDLQGIGARNAKASVAMQVSAGQ
ncbi:MAG: hypothetical protein D6769_01500 [Methanobacteriota archaeon]|nr:MAG: hypothetical protein D6769_01500 [Euryarchaeota archaeon]